MITITMPGSIPYGLGGNARGNRYELGRIRKDWREAWFLRTRSVMAEFGITEPFPEVSATVSGYFCRSLARAPEAVYMRSTGQRPKDLDNLLGCMKSAIDGIVQAGLVPDDSAQYVTIAAPHLYAVPTFDEERVEVLVEPLT